MADDIEQTTLQILTCCNERPALVAHNSHNVISTPVQAVKDTSSVAANESVVQGLGLFNKIVATAVKGRQ
jgi:hypothetical protein